MPFFLTKNDILSKVRARSLVPTPFTNLVVLKSHDCWNKLVPLIESFSRYKSRT